MENSNVLSVRAYEDLKPIALFTIEKFGLSQSENYKKDLVSVVNKLSDNPKIGREYIVIKGKMLSRFRFKAHTIFYYPDQNRIVIVRILWNKMSFLKHLSSK